jgi:hypothetical protein
MRIDHGSGRGKELMVVLGIVLFAGVVRIPSLPQPLGPDQGIMAVIGEGILHGGLPYRDYWEMGSPAIFLTYSLMFKIFGPAMTTVPLVDMIVSMLTTLLIYLFARALWNRRAGYISALLFAFFSNGIRLGMHAGGDVAFGTFWTVAQRETFMLPLIVLSFYVLLGADEAKRESWRFLLSGFLAGLVFAYKFSALPFLAVLLLYLNGRGWLNRKRTRLRKLWLKNAVLLAGFLLALVPFVLFFALRGALKDMTDVIFTYVSSVYGRLESNTLGIIKMGLVRTLFIARENFILWIFSLAAGLYMLASDRRPGNILVILWAAAAALFVVMHREFFGYHYLVVLPPLSLLSGYGFMTSLGPRPSLGRIFREEPVHVFMILALLANLAFFTTLNYTHYTKFFYLATGRMSRAEYEGFFRAYPKHEYSFPADSQVARYLSAHTDPDERIYVLGGTESVIYFLSKRPPASRFIFSWILFSETHGRGEQAEAYRQELLADLEKKSPRYIVTIKPLDAYQQFAAIYRFLKEHYILEKTFPDERFVYVATINHERKT